jgi:amino acid transporter
MSDLHTVRPPGGVDPPKVPVANTELRAGALGLTEVLVQGLAHMAPAAGIILTIQVITGFAGVVSPLAYLFAFIIILGVGVGLTQLAKHLPSAGGYYTFISRTIHPRAGFMTSWAYFLYDPLGGTINLVFMGFILETTLKSEANFTFPWWLFFILAGAFVSVVAYLGIRFSGRTLIVLAAAELSIMLTLAIFGLFQPGEGGLNLDSFVPSNATSTNGLFLGVIFSIFAFTGFESVVPLAEESRSPRSTIPKAIMSSIFIMGALYVFVSWALLIGWGTSDVPALIGSEENPVFAVAKNVWGAGWWIVVAALVNSVLAVAISCNNAATRVFYAMGRSGSLPRALGRVGDRFKTPVNAVTLQLTIMWVVGLGLGLLIGPEEEFILLGLALTLAMVLVYAAGNLGVFLLYRGQHRPDFNAALHLLIPLITSIALFYVGYKSLQELTSPASYAPWVVAGWLLLGIALLCVMRYRGQEDWLLHAGEVAQEIAIYPEDTAEHHEDDGAG